jgi:hypothetical protein
MVEATRYTQNITLANHLAASLYGTLPAVATFIRIGSSLLDVVYTLAVSIWVLRCYAITYREIRSGRCRTRDLSTISQALSIKGLTYAEVCCPLLIFAKATASLYTVVPTAVLIRMIAAIAAEDANPRDSGYLTNQERRTYLCDRYGARFRATAYFE